ncbi:MAG: 1-phosphofructokinase family hexose kinase [Actinomycetota bacterium]
MNARNNSKNIVIACPNLSLDRTMSVEGLALGRVHRSTRSDTRGGGKGVNVARALRHMDRESLLVGLAGGRTGEAVAGLLQDEGLALVALESPGETRSCLSVISDTSMTVFNESGPRLDDTVWSRYEAAVLEHLVEGDLFVCSGSFQPGTPDDAAERLVREARERGCLTVCDTSRAHLARALAARPDVIKPNLPEALGVLDEADDEPVEAGADALHRARDAALRLLERGPRIVIVSAGEAGLVYATEGRAHMVEAPRVKVLNPVGAGDCLVAGVALELGRGASLGDAVLTGTAMGAAGCETFAAGVVVPDRVRRLRAAISS